MEKVIDVFNQTMPKEISQRECLCFLGLVIADKLVNKEAFRSSMANLWQLKRYAAFKEVGLNLFISRPWSFDRNLICLTNYNGNLTPQKVQFKREPMWFKYTVYPSR